MRVTDTGQGGARQDSRGKASGPASRARRTASSLRPPEAGEPACARVFYVHLPTAAPRGRVLDRTISGLRGRTGGPRDPGKRASAPSRHQRLDGGRYPHQPLFPRQLLPVAEQRQDRRPGCRNAHRERGRCHPRFPGRKAAGHVAAVPASPSPDTTPPVSRRAARPRMTPGATDQKRSAQSRVSTRSLHRRRRPPAHHHRPDGGPRVSPVIGVRRMAGLHDLGIGAVDEQSLPVAHGPVTDPFCPVPGGHEVYRGCLGMPR
jgi:hypothetical protein